MSRRTTVAIALATGTAAASAGIAVTGPASAQPVDPGAVLELAAAKADALVASRPSVLKGGRYDAFQRQKVLTSHGLNYVPYLRTYKGLQVRGGDFVVVTDSTGATRYTSVAQSSPIGALSTTPKLTATAAAAITEKQLEKVAAVEGTTLVVVTDEGKPARLAWETTVQGIGAEGYSRLSVSVDALTGEVLRTQENAVEVTGSGTGWIYGPVSVNSTRTGSTYSLTDPNQTTLTCQDDATKKTFSKSTNTWGNGDGTDKETGCVDAFYVAQQQAAMLSQWLGRNGQDGNGGAWPIRVGLTMQNAYFDGLAIRVGRNAAGRWVSSADVVGHELGHGIDASTPGGLSQGRTAEFVADIFGAATEWFANNPNDPPDYLVGEQVDLFGRGPIRNMYNPSALGHPNCYSDSIPSQLSSHEAAGPGNHWFYLLAQGTGSNGQPASPTCDNTSINGLGVQKAMTIMYNAMLMKTSNASYLKYRTWTLTATKNLYPNSCTEFNTVKAAWDAVSVPAQSADPTCIAATGP